MTIGNRMKIRRKELGLTQKELASEVKLSQNYLSELERVKQAERNLKTEKR